ncbi:MAG: GDSL-type esterase/lipase family protein [Candidatus Nomurabacteria bacterium]|nr:GDSL-type esterase/lipase family protein [Candidatus Nomurabacteria bacterium]
MITANQQDVRAVGETFIQVFADDFNRADGAVGNGWEVAARSGASGVTTWNVNGNKLALTNSPTGSGWDAHLLRPSSEAQQDAKISTALPGLALNKFYGLVSRYHNDITDGKTFYGAFIFKTSAGNVNIRIKAVKNDADMGTNNSNVSQIMSETVTVDDALLSAAAKFEFSAVSISPSQTQLTVTIFDDQDNEIATRSVNDTTPILQTAGQWGVSSYTMQTVGVQYDDITVSAVDRGLQFDIDKENVKFGENVELTLSGLVEQTVTLGDGGAGGTFLPSNVVTLNAGNGYNAVVNYTPQHLGDIEILGTTNVNDDELRGNIFVIPYSTTIGFIGDSITVGSMQQNPVAAACAVQRFSCLNRGVGDSDTDDWATDNFSGHGTPPATGADIMSDALTAFGAAGVEVVHIMLGANDAEIGVKNSVATYKTNMQTIIDTLKNAGIRQVILSYPTYFGISGGRDAESQALNLAYQTAVDDLVSENGGFALLGDTSAYAWFEANTSALADGTHPTNDGYTQLGQFWATAIRSVLEYEIAPDHSWSAGDNSFTLGESGTLTHTIDKYYGEFAGVVKVNGTTLTNGTDYTASEGSTVIELLNSYLNTLGAGTYTLSVQFAGGVWVDTTFTISAAGVITPTPTDPNAPAVPVVPGVPNTGRR